MNNGSIPVKPDHVTWTDDQWKAIWAKGQDILVAAAAGSGKTAVLVERIIQKILSEEDRMDVDELLVVTFTNASAAEMRHRIGVALEKAIDEDPHSRHLRKQLSLLNRASISTLHSFCLEVIRKYYYLIDIDPGFRIADETEGDLLRDEVLDDLFEEEYGKEDNQDFFRLVDTFTNDRSDGALQDMIRKLYDFSRSHPNPDEWLRRLKDLYEVEEGKEIDQLSFIEPLLTDIRLQLHGAKSLFQRALDLTRVPGGPGPRAENFLSDIEIVESLEESLATSWNTLYETIQTLPFTKLKACRGDDYDKEIVDEAKKLRDQGKKTLEKIQEDFFSRRPGSFLEDMRKMKDVIHTLAEVVIEFGTRFRLVKEEKGLVDFADLEHFCLDILRDPSSEALVPSEAANLYKNKFKEVLVDEYQDTNMVQESILLLITEEREEIGNRFMVGDVKQSIYRFRLAEPNLFLGKYTRFLPERGEAGLKIDLSQNFRSRKEVLEGTNFLFKQIMGPSVGEMEYNREAELVKGAPYPEETEYPIEVAIIDQESEEPSGGGDEEGLSIFDEGDIEKSVLEARYMANKVKRMIEERTPVYDAKTKTERPIQYRDVVILLRSMPWAAEIMEEFKRQGIPIYANLSTGYFEATEIAIMLSLLKVIDNPYQDIPLASVLRSPIVGLDEQGLASIRIHSRAGTYYEALKTFASEKPGNPREEETFEKVKVFLYHLGNWRTKARQGSVTELIWQLYRDTRFYDYVGGMAGGKQRQANLRALYDRARQYEETSFRGLFRFLRFIDRMRERGDDLGVARALSEQEDVVRLMTIHSSKGLEFPVVFVAGTSKQFNLMDLNAAYLLDKDLGLAVKYTDAAKRISYPSLPQLAFKRKKRMEAISEEMRVLYVALTRAKEKLYLVGTVKSLEKSLKKWRGALSQTDWLLSDYDRAGASSYLDWIGPSLMRHPQCGELGSSGASGVGLMNEEILKHPSCFQITKIHKSELIADEDEKMNEEKTWQEKVKNGEVVDIVSSHQEEVLERLSWEYPHIRATNLRSKQSVSELKRMVEVRDEASSIDILRQHQKPVYNRPQFMQSKELSPAEKGTAMHTVMQHISFDDGVPTEEKVEDLLSRLVQKEILTEEQKLAVSVEHIAGFFKSGLGQRMANARNIEREIPFSMSVPLSEISETGEEAPEETILVQGVIDCVFRDESGIVLLDYKTDGIHDRYQGGFTEARPVLEERYKVQIELYTRALESIWKEPVAEKYLYFFDGGHVLEL
ncbi:helicase-exonuclease AddAB subunit AddA [Rossellomorea sp. KS-H15a]|uniref:helicase-exonuclease AddAB subunit AddA n=1 Tax=Rossellomorea sp. KS-H15a TaxID=2963940 RepID=UPI0020C5C997|nr:helicase-exonuclease AddAB subunit AddA [Rossellomorea sp. KS-H15a]UTE79087.1 helicase-exonuclease AddAB subunit AddA [Rossellomorea sp. KS-H15a]